jgi:hypothetical protein
VENHVCLSHGVQVAGAAWCAGGRCGMAGRTRDGQALVGYSVAE